MKKIIQFKLKILARLILKKYQPVIIGITGSIGKTSTKEAVVKVLGDHLRVRSSFKNYNNEIGLPLTIIGSASPGRSLIGWQLVFWRAVRLLLFRDSSYPEVLALEMGVDRPGDLAYLLSIAPATVGIVTSVSYAHLEYFGSIANIKKEKQVLIEELDNKGLAILNFDNEYAKEMAQVSKARVISYGLKEGADLRAQDIVYNYSKGGYELAGINFKLNYKGSIVPVSIKNAMSESTLYAALAAAATGIYFDFNLVEIAQALQDFSLPPGRMNLLPGIKHTFIIDDTYNSSPEAAVLALQTVGRMKIDQGAKKYAALGDMLEIGNYTEEGHRLVGEQVFKNGLDYLVAVGERSWGFVAGAKTAGMDEDHIFHFDFALEAGKFLQDRIKEGDVLLAKGSQGARMEKVVKELMAEPDKAAELIVRQGTEWDNK